MFLLLNLMVSMTLPYGLFLDSPFLPVWTDFTFMSLVHTSVPYSLLALSLHDYLLCTSASSCSSVLAFSYGNLGMRKPNFSWKHCKSVDPFAKVMFPNLQKIEENCIHYSFQQRNRGIKFSICNQFIGFQLSLCYIDTARRFETWMPWAISVEITVNCQCCSYYGDTQKLWLLWHHFVLPQSWILKSIKRVGRDTGNWLWYKGRISNVE